MESCVDSPQGRLYPGGVTNIVWWICKNRLCGAKRRKSWQRSGKSIRRKWALGTS